MKKSQQIKIFDTTLRDGQQCPGAGMSFKQNIAYARLAKKIGVDFLEAGFPTASQMEFDIVHTIAKEIVDKDSALTVAALCQLRESQVDDTIKALEPAIPFNRARLHVYVPVDPNLMPVSLGEYANDKPLIIKDVYRFIQKSVQCGLEVEFSPEGYSRMADNFDFVTDLIRAAISAGATVINCPDTIGGACKLQGKDYFVKQMKRHAKIIQNEFPNRTITWSAHCHNDFGLALSNTINAVFEGPATQVEGCFNGIGERAGNLPLEQFIMYVACFGMLHPSKSFFTNIHTEIIQEISDFVDKHMLPRQPHWPISGENVAKHSAGGHTNAILKNPLVYQPFDPRQTGKKITFIFGPLSGSNHAQSIIQENGYVCEEDEKVEITQFIKHYYVDRRKGITDNELMEAYFEYRSPIRVSKFNYTKDGEENTLQLTGRFFDHADTFETTYFGRDSALAALLKAINQYIADLTIETYNSEAVGKGIGAISKSTIILSTPNNRLFTGIGEDQDIEISAMKALIHAVNQVFIEENYKIQV